MAYNVYSFPDVKANISHTDIGSCALHQSGMGKITVSAAGDLSSHTVTADGYVIVNRLKTTSGTITIEVPQGSVADWFLRKWSRWARSLKDPSRIALGVLTIQDSSSAIAVTRSSFADSSDLRTAVAWDSLNLSRSIDIPLRKEIHPHERYCKKH